MYTKRGAMYTKRGAVYTSSRNFFKNFQKRSKVIQDPPYAYKKLQNSLKIIFWLFEEPQFTLNKIPE